MMDPNEATQLSKLSSLTKEPSLTDDPDLLAKILEQAGIQHTRAGVLDPVADFAQRLTALRPQSMIGWALRGFADFRSGGNAYADHLKFSAEVGEKPHPYSRVLVSVMLSEIGVDPRGLDYPESVHLLQSFCQAQNADPQISDPGDDEQNTAPEDDS